MSRRQKLSNRMLALRAVVAPLSACLIALFISPRGSAIEARAWRLPVTGIYAPAHRGASAPLFPQDLPEVTLTLRAEGFAPDALTRPAGRFRLSVDNRSGVEEITLRLNREDGTLVREMFIRRGTVDWSEVIDLAAGVYVLSEVSHPAWVCRITAQ